MKRSLVSGSFSTKGRSGCFAQENLQAQCDVSVPILVVPLEDICHTLQTDASLHKQVEAQSLLPVTLVASSSRSLGVRVEQQLHELRAQAVSKRHQRIREFLHADVPAPVCIKSIEQPTPCGEETPEAAELLEVDCAAAVRVEHSNHHLDGVRVEGCVVSIDKRAAELVLGELAGAVLIDLHEERPKTIAVILVSRRRTDGGRTLLLRDWWAVV